MVKRKKSKRKRMTKEQTKARMTQSGNGGDWFTLPNGIERWIPEKKGTFLIDVLPYEVSTENHPEDGIESGVLWFRSQFRVHHGIGVKEQSVICPRSIGKACAICDEVDRLRKEDRDANEDLINSLRGQVFSIMNIKHPDDEDAVAVFCLSYGKFDKLLKEELQEEENEEHLDFYQCDEGGRTLRTRFSEKSFAGNKYLAATQIQFKSRDNMDEDEILGKVADLDTILNVLPSEKIKAVFLEGEEPEGDDEEEVKSKPKKKGEKKKPADKKAGKKKPEPEEEEDWDDEDEEEEEEEKEIPEGMIECIACEGSGKSSKGKKCTPCKGKGFIPEPEDEEEEEEEDWDEEDEEEEEEVKPKSKSKKKSKPKQEPEEEEDDEDDWDDEDEEEEEEEVKPKKSDKKKSSKKKPEPEPEEEEDDEDDWDDEDDDDDWDDEEE